ncbi:hypothetical protein [Prevotella pectinovora]|jgi:hypothetical protein|uniref:hypothetical protein n=1 Tax=Prevotella pectinovora TaxID=1602169 RepID=UPI0030807162
MNKSIKITLLIVAIIAAVGGVMAYYKTIVSPPSHMRFNNQYIAAIKSDIAEVVNLSTTDGLDSSFVATTHEINFMWKNTLLQNTERNELLESFAVQYIPKFVEDCNGKFAATDWSDIVLKQMSKKITQLRSLKTTDGTYVVGGEANTSLEKVQNTISNYYAAKAAASHTGYTGLADAIIKIATAKKYASMSPINNCMALVNQLNSVPKRLEQSHFAYLVNQVNRLNNYYNYDQSSYDDLALSISEKLDEYKKNARKVYGCMSDIASLEQRAGELYSNAHFDSEISSYE